MNTPPENGPVWAWRAGQVAQGLVMGALLGWIMLSVIGPIYDVIGKIKT